MLTKRAAVIDEDDEMDVDDSSEISQPAESQNNETEKAPNSSLLHVKENRISQVLVS